MQNFWSIFFDYSLTTLLPRFKIVCYLVMKFNQNGGRWHIDTGTELQKTPRWLYKGYTVLISVHLCDQCGRAQQLTHSFNSNWWMLWTLSRIVKFHQIRKVVIHKLYIYMKIEKKLENKPRFFEEYKKDQELTFPADHLIGRNCNIKIIRVTQQWIGY